ncbi:Hypothetical predicted protein, partial [Paramuricea clavata]
MTEANLKTKITLLQMATEKSDAILNGNKKRAIARHGESLKETIAVVNKLRLTVEAENISKETSAEEIEEWNKTVENTIEKADGMVEILEQWLDEQDARKEKIQLEEKAEREEIEREKQLQFVLKLHEDKVKLQSEIAPEVSVYTRGNDPSKKRDRRDTMTRHYYQTQQGKTEQSKWQTNARLFWQRKSYALIALVRHTERQNVGAQGHPVLTAHMEIQELSVDGKFNMEIELSKVHKPQLLMINNPNFKGLCETYTHLEGSSQETAGNLIRKLKLKKNELFEEYNAVIEEQLQKGIVEAAPEIPTGNVYYIPHKAVVKKEAESTKLRIVYDASAREDNTKPSLNDFKSRFNHVLLTSDLKKAFLQIRIKQEERDSLRFHWKEPDCDGIKVYRFTRALFGRTSSPFLLAGVLNQHLDAWEDRYPELVKELREGLYVDDLMTGGVTVEETGEKKVMAAELFEDATFSFHKWHSKAKELEGDSGTSVESEDIAKSYDPLGLVSPTVLVAKLLYRDICDSKISWDAQLPEPLLKRWKSWRSSLTEELTVPSQPRPLTPHRVLVTGIELHSFGDASSQGVCVAVYPVVHQVDEVTQGLVCAKSGIAKRNQTIPRLEFIAGHMAVNLVSNVETGKGDYRQFVANRVRKIQEHSQ